MQEEVGCASHEATRQRPDFLYPALGTGDRRLNFVGVGTLCARRIDRGRDVVVALSALDRAVGKDCAGIEHRINF